MGAETITAGHTGSGKTVVEANLVGTPCGVAIAVRDRGSSKRHQFGNATAMVAKP